MLRLTSRQAHAAASLLNEVNAHLDHRCDQIGEEVEFFRWKQDHTRKKWKLAELEQLWRVREHVAALVVLLEASPTDRDVHRPVAGPAGLPPAPAAIGGPTLAFWE